MRRREFLTAGTAAALMAGCKPAYDRATDAEVRAAFYRHPAPPSIALLSMCRTSDDVSEHSGILVNASQRVLYDPAGNYWVPGRARQRDIHYGMTDYFVEQYERFHSRLGFYVRRQTVEVPMEVAELAIKRSEERGETYFTQCAVSASWVLRDLPGFAHIRLTIDPHILLRDFSRTPGIVEKVTREEDTGKNIAGVPGYDPNDTAPPPKPEFGRG